MAKATRTTRTFSAAGKPSPVATHTLRAEQLRRFKAPYLLPPTTKKAARFPLARISISPADRGARSRTGEAHRGRCLACV